MSRIEINGIYKHAPLTNAQIAGTKRNLDREIIVKIDSVTPRSALIPDVTTPATDANAYPTSYIYAMDYDSTDDGGTNPNIRRHIPTLELLGSKGSADDNGGVQGTAGSSWINIETTPTGTYTSLTGGQTLQAALEALDGAASSAGLKHLIDGTQDGSLISSINGSTASSTITGTGTYNIALGRINTINNTAYSGILNGESNIISGLDSDHKYNTIINGNNNIISITSSGIWNSRSLIGTGQNNYIQNGGNSSILSGQNNYIVTATNSIYNSSILSGSNNYLIYASYSVIGAGQDNKIQSTVSGSVNYNGVFAGSNNYITDGSYSFIGAGDNNYVGYNYNAIVTGSRNHISNTYNITYSVITGGYRNYVNGSHSIIGAGDRNYINNGYYCAILSGSGNYIPTNDINTTITANNCIILGGNNNKTSGNNTSIVSGNNNTILDNSFDSSISSGFGNYISDTSRSSINSGSSNSILTSYDSFIGSGGSNIATSSDYSTIVSGYLNKLYESDYSGILTGNANYINGNYNVIGGGNENYIQQSSTHSFIGSGSDNYIQQSSTHSFIGSGSDNYIQQGSTHSFIGSGSDNYIQSSASYSFIGSGTNINLTSGSNYLFVGTSNNVKIDSESSNSTILNAVNAGINFSKYSIILGGNTNYIALDSPSDGYNNIFNGTTNYIQGTSEYSTIINGTNNDIQSNNAIISGVGNTINSSGGYNNILNGSSNQINGTGTYNNILSGGGNQISAGSYNNILSGGGNQINSSGNYNILSGGGNQINGSVSYNSIISSGGSTIDGTLNYSSILAASGTTISGSTYSVTMGGSNNTIVGSTSCGIFGADDDITGSSNGSWILGSGNAINASSDSVILGNGNIIDGFNNVVILGSGITANRQQHTYTRGITLMEDREFRLTGKTPNIGDVPIVESIDGDVAVLTWGSPYGVNADPTPTSDFSFYYIEVNGSTIIPNTTGDNQYIKINEADNEPAVITNRKFKIGSSKNGYNSSDPDTSLEHIFDTTVPSTPPAMIESIGISIEDGYEYTIGFDIVNLQWNGQYLSDNEPALELMFNHNIKVIRDGSTRTIKLGTDTTSTNITSNYIANTINNIDYTSTDSNDNTTLGINADSISLLTSYNYTTDQVNIGWNNLFAHQAYVKKFEGTYSKDPSSVDINVNWPVGYDLPPLGFDDIHFWVSDPSTNASLPDVEVSQVEVKGIAGNIVTISHASYSALPSATDAPCWVHVNDRNPTLNLYMRLAVAKYKY